MKFVNHTINIDENWRDGKQPTFALARPSFKNPDSATPVSRRVGTFWVPESPIIAGKPVKWSLTRIGDHVRIPLNAYIVRGSRSDLAASYVELGVRAVNNLMMANHFTPYQAREWELHLVQGTQAIETQDHPGWRYAVGLAIRTE